MHESEKPIQNNMEAIKSQPTSQIKENWIFSLRQFKEWMMVDIMCLNTSLWDYKTRYEIIVLVKSQKVWKYYLATISIKIFAAFPNLLMVSRNWQTK